MLLKDVVVGHKDFVSEYLQSMKIRMLIFLKKGNHRWGIDIENETISCKPLSNKRINTVSNNFRIGA